MYIYRIFYISIHTGYFSREFQKKKKKVSLRLMGHCFFFFKGGGGTGVWAAVKAEDVAVVGRNDSDGVGGGGGGSSGSECVDFKALSSASLTHWSSVTSSSKNSAAKRLQLPT